MKQFLMGSEIVVKAAAEAGAEFFYAYPITPASEIMQFWLKEMDKNPKLKFLQNEDEISAGFTTLGTILGGGMAFTATAGPGNILMQDALAMAENMRIPIVAVIGQRGGPSTGTVIYSQQEVTLTAFGGNGEGYRVVYSPSGLQELYHYTKKAFNTAWKYRFPTFVLTDGYTTKLRGEVDFEEKNNDESISTESLFGKESEYLNYRNCYEYEEEIYNLNMELKRAFDSFASEIEEHEIYSLHPKGETDMLIVAHGIVALAAKAVVEKMENKNISLFRPITLRPFPEHALRDIAQKTKKILVVESAADQIYKTVKQSLYGLSVPIEHIGKPGLGVYPEEIESFINTRL